MLSEAEYWRLIPRALWSLSTRGKNNPENCWTPRLLVPLAVDPQINSREIVGYVDLDVEGVVVGLDIDHASKLLDLPTLEAESLPLRLAAGI